MLIAFLDEQKYENPPVRLAPLGWRAGLNPPLKKGEVMISSFIKGKNPLRTPLVKALPRPPLAKGGWGDFRDN